MQLRETCEFWAYERQHVSCCQFADDELLETESDLFNCETCPVEAHLVSLDADNRRAWQLAHLLLTRFVAETHSFGPALARLTADLDEDEFADLLRRLTIIYDGLVPAPQRRD